MKYEIYFLWGLDSPLNRRYILHNEAAASQNKQVPKMLKIGDFSKIAYVTIKALRYYDELGLLKPVSVDQFTG